jgi:hypothetical protein
MRLAVVPPAAPVRPVQPVEPAGPVPSLEQAERDALEAWLRWGSATDQQALDRAMARVPVQLRLTAW